MELSGDFTEMDSWNSLFSISQELCFFRWLLKNSTNYSHYFIALTWMGLHWVKLSHFGFNTGACFFASKLITGDINSDWSLHLEAFTKLLLYDRAYNHDKYMSQGLIYLYGMYELPQKHPDLHQYFMKYNSVMKYNSIYL